MRMIFKGVLSKMFSELLPQVQYRISYKDQSVLMNDFIGKSIKISYNGVITCLDCGKTTPKSFNQGFCYQCFVNSPINSPCIIKPELCEAHLGKGRDVAWETKNHLQPHFVYFSLTSGVKVGVTRATQVPTRWIDQGASQALLFAKTPNRYLAGCIEVALKSYMADKTNWRKMLTGIAEEKNLIEVKQNCKQYLPSDLLPYYSNEDNLTKINYPLKEYPIKVTSHNLDKNQEVDLVLKGIKGQYLIFEQGIVMNVRKYGGYNVSISLS